MSVTLQTVTFFGPTKSLDYLNRMLAETCGTNGKAELVYYKLEYVEDFEDQPVTWPRVHMGVGRVGSFGDVDARVRS